MSEPNVSPIEASEQTLGKVFSDAFAFEIPAYQRPYAWEEEQAEALLDDLLEAVNHSNPGGVYFLGSVVLIKTPNASEAKVVDGQQRLTTLTILLSVLRDLTTDVRAKINREQYIFQDADPDKGTSKRFRLLLRAQDRPFFAKHVQEPGATDSIPAIDGLEGSHARVAENASLFRTRLTALAEEQRNQLFAYIIQRCYLVVVSVPTAEAARRIFTVLNSRGLDLTATDILKASLLERAGPVREAELALRWEAVERALDRSRFVELFGHVRFAFEREKPRSALETGFAQAVGPFGGDPGKFITDILEPYADAMLLLSDVAEVQSRFGSDTSNIIRSLDRLDNKDWVAPALYQIVRSNEGSVQIDLPGFFRSLERVAYYLFLTRADANTRAHRYADVLDQLAPRAGKQPRSPGLDLTPEECTEFVQALDGPIYKKSRVCKPVLLKLDTALAGGGAHYENVVSIEHVLPQTADSKGYWEKQFPRSADRDEWTHRLANLVLLTRRANASASNWDFETKKKKYFQSKNGRAPFPITQTVLEADQWTVDILKDRQSKFISTLTAAWQLNSANPETVKSE